MENSGNIIVVPEKRGIIETLDSKFKELFKVSSTKEEEKQSINQADDKSETISQLNEKYLEEFKSVQREKATLEDDRNALTSKVNLGLSAISTKFALNKIFASKAERNFCNAAIVVTQLLKPISKLAIKFGFSLKKKKLDKKEQESAVAYLEADEEVLGYSISEDQKVEILNGLSDEVEDIAVLAA